MKIVAVALLLPTLAWAAPPECLTVKAVPDGELCTIRPSHTDPMIQDVGEGAHGFGDHVIAFPSEPDDKLWVHFSGTGGKPFLPQQQRYLNEVWLAELLGQGYTVIDLAYDSEVSITEQCKGANPPLNNCAGAARVEILTGLDTSPIRQVSVANSITHRAQALIKFMQDNEFPLPDAELWEGVSVSGHSQGAGHAYYLAKNYGVTQACFLGGPYDVPDPVPQQRPPAKFIADWYLDTTHDETKVTSMGAFLTKDDPYYQQFVMAYGIIGMEWIEIDKKRYADLNGKAVDGHAAAVQDPSLADQRAKACF